MSEERKKKGTGIWWLLGIVGLGAWALSAKAGAASTPGAALTPAQQVEIMTQWIKDQLGKYGYALREIYAETGSPTMLPVDATSAGRDLVARSQAATDNFLGYFWALTEIKKGLWDPNVDAAKFQNLQNIFAKIQSDFTPQFLA